MKLTDLNTKSRAEAGAFCHLSHPSGGHLLYTGEGTDAFGRCLDPDAGEVEKVGVMVRGVEAPTIKAVVERLQKRAATRWRKEGRGNPPREGAPLNEEEMMEFACALVVAFVNIDDDNGQPLEATAENKRRFFDQSMDLAVQVVEFARSSANFFSPESAA